MKTKLFYLFIAVFLFSIGSKAQTTTSCPASNTWLHCISLIGPGTPGGDWATDTYLTSLDGDVYTAVDLQFSAADIKFRQDGCWDGCPGNTAGYGPAAGAGTGWPSGSGISVPFGPNIQCPGGVWNVKFTLSTAAWEFTAGTPNPVIKLTGTSVSGSPVTMSTTNGKQYTLKKATLVPGTCQFEINGVAYGALTFPTGSAQSTTENIPVATTGIDYDVTFDYLTADYTFAIATFPKIAIIGAGAGGWPNDPQVDANAMTTTDGVTYTISHIALTTGPIKFRQDNAWNNNWGGTTWSSGATAGSDIPAVGGNYNGTFNKTTGAYSFTLNTIAVVGSGVGGWPNDPQVDANVMSTTNGIDYTLNGLVVTNGAAKFRENNAWGTNWGGVGFPLGTTSGSDIVTVAGTYNLTFNRTTGAYDFGTNLGVNKFDSKSFSAYPNPTRDSWNIVSGNDDITSIRVYDVLGKSVYARAAASKEVTVNASELSSGVYYAKVATANGESTVKLVKE